MSLEGSQRLGSREANARASRLLQERIVSAFCLIVNDRGALNLAAILVGLMADIRRWCYMSARN